MNNKFIIVSLAVALIIGVVLTIVFSLPKEEPSPSFSPSPSPSSSQPPITEEPFTEVLLTKSFIEPEDISLEEIDIEPQISSYQLPLNLSTLSNQAEFFKKIQLSNGSRELLSKNGFVVVDTPEDIAKQSYYDFEFGELKASDEFSAYYEALKDKDIPIFVTSDTLLHFYHIFFDSTLMRLERDVFYNDVWQFSEEFYQYLLAEYNKISSDQEELKEALKRDIAYISVALELLKPKENQILTEKIIREEICADFSDFWCESRVDELMKEENNKYFSVEDAKNYSFEIPDFVKDTVEKELSFIEGHEGWENSPIFLYEEDYSQYVPRGHYTKSEVLKNYFRALMWYGRITALIKGSPNLGEGESMCTGVMDGIISEYDAKIQTLQATILSKKFAQSETIQKSWQRVYAITSFMVGVSDDLGPSEYGAVLKSVLENQTALTDILANYEKIRNKLQSLKYEPKIYSGLGNCQLFMPCPPLSDEEIESLKPQAEKLLAETKGFRLMGQRFTTDSWIFSEIVSPYSGEYSGDRPELPGNGKPFTFSWDDEFSREQENRPFSWTKTEVKACPPPAYREVKGFPRGLDVMAVFGSKRAKEILDELGDSDYSDYDKKLSELKETVANENWYKNIYSNWLYVLQSLFKEYGKGYQSFMQTKAWQDKQLNTALGSWAELRHDTILYVKQSYTMAELGGGGPLPPVIEGYVEPVPEFYNRLLTLTKLTKSGLTDLIPEEELKKIMISSSLKNLTEVLERLLDISQKELKNQSLTKNDYDYIDSFGNRLQHIIQSLSGSGDLEADVLKSVMVADVHTDGNTKKVLEEGLGYLRTLVAAYKMPQGNIVLGAGPVFSYYEFKHPMKDRLTDESWREMLDSGKSPKLPKWINNFSE